MVYMRDDTKALLQNLVSWLNAYIGILNVISQYTWKLYTGQYSYHVNTASHDSA